MAIKPIKQTSRAPLRFGILTLLAMAAAGSATDGFAQTADCSAYRAELAAISRGADPRAREYTVAAQRQRAELERTRNYYNQIGCTRSDNFRPVGECAPLRAHMQQMQANLNEMLAYADRLGGGRRSQERRRQLQAALDRYCANQPERPRGFFERLFGGSQATNEPPPVPEEQIPEVAATREERGLGGSQPVCVRLADGYFFPLGARFQGASHAQQVCQAQCPATRTELFFMSQGGVIERAQSATGVPYSMLPNARVYQKRLVPEASCVPAGQNWEQALQSAQTLIGSHEDDIIVTAEKAEELSRPAAVQSASRSRSRTARTPPPADAEDIADAAAVPTAGGESAGIGPGIARDDTTLSRREGTMVTAAAPDGSRRNVRIVAPYLIPTPDTLRRN
ncbi:DUF2865 domain-containing protein [Pseudochelatococcus sp. B33]